MKRDIRALAGARWPAREPMSVEFGEMQWAEVVAAADGGWGGWCIARPQRRGGRSQAIGRRRELALQGNQVYVLATQHTDGEE